MQLWDAQWIGWLASPVPHEIFWMGFVNYLKTTPQTMKSKNAHECTPNSGDELKDASGSIPRSKGWRLEDWYCKKHLLMSCVDLQSGRQLDFTRWTVETAFNPSLTGRPSCAQYGDSPKSCWLLGIPMVGLSLGQPSLLMCRLSINLAFILWPHHTGMSLCSKGCNRVKTLLKHPQLYQKWIDM